MLNSDLVKRLYEEMVNNPDMMNKTEWKAVLEIIMKEKDKNPNEEFVSLKSAVRVYLGASNDYNHLIFTKICETQEELEYFYDKMVRQFIAENSSLSEKRIEKMLKSLKIHFDLYSEIVDYLLAGGVYKKALISVEGYDVNKLCSDYQLSLVGAYNYLVYLREDPENALANLKVGLPRNYSLIDNIVECK